MKLNFVSKCTHCVKMSCESVSGGTCGDERMIGCIVSPCSVEKSPSQSRSWPTIYAYESVPLADEIKLLPMKKEKQPPLYEDMDEQA